MKPVTKEKIDHALSMLRETRIESTPGEELYIRCFGGFEVFYDGEPPLPGQPHEKL